MDGIKTPKLYNKLALLSIGFLYIIINIIGRKLIKKIINVKPPKPNITVFGGNL